MEKGKIEFPPLQISQITTSEAYTHAGVKNVHSSPLEPRILRFSELGEAPPEDDKSTFIEKALLVVFMMTFLTLLIPLVPLILVASLLQRVKVSHQKYHTDANELRIAVIGGGWSGQQCIARLHELGVTHVKGFERNGSYGGTWHEKLRYYSVQIHGAMWITGFKDFAYSNDRDVNDGKVLGEEMLLDFLGRFVREKNLQHAYKYNTRVVGIDYFTSNRKATLKLEVQMDQSLGQRRSMIWLFMQHRRQNQIFQIFQTGNTLKDRFIIPLISRRMYMMELSTMTKE